jgi:exonuclease SbcD
MRLFPLADLHLGKTLRGWDLLEDQAYILDLIAAAAREAKPDAILIAGDVYDRPVPPVEAIKLFDGFLRALREAAPGIRVIVVPGNHDSAGRLSFGASLLADSGLVIATRAEARPVLSLGEGGGRVDVWALPFLTQASADWAALEASVAAARGAALEAAANSAGEGEEGASAADSGAAAKPACRPQQELMALATGAIRAAMKPGAANVLVAHCFASGAMTSESESAFVGAAEQVDVGLFAGFDYVALGHLHRAQSPVPRLWYSGAPLAYSTGEAGAEKEFIDVELVPGAAPRVEHIPLVPRRRVRVLSGFFDELIAHPLPAPERDDYIEVRLLDDDLILNAADRLKALYPRLLGAQQKALEARGGEAGGGDPGGEGASGRRAARAKGSPDRLQAASEDFAAFHAEMTGEAPDESLAKLFAEIAREAADASA